MVLWLFIFMLGLGPSIPHIYLQVEALQLVLHPTGDKGENLIVLDVDGSRAFCYPEPDEMVVQGHAHLPTRHRDHGLDPSHDESQLRNNARVICREVSGFTHVEKYYRVTAPKDMPKSTKRVKWMAECLGYEPLLSHCFSFNVSDVSSQCNELLGIKCGYCSKKLKLDIGESQVITNPQYPHYSDDLICEWVIETPTYAIIKVTFNDFELPPRNEKGNCHRGLLEIKRARRKDSEESQKNVIKTVTTLCGSALPDPVSFAADAAVIRFSSGLFVPRPTGEDAGFNLTITIVEAAVIDRKGILGLGEIMAVILGCLLVLFVFFFICYVIRRYRKDRQSSIQRRLMQERLATHRQGRQDAALTAILAASLQQRGSGIGPLSPPVPAHKYNDDPQRRERSIEHKDRAYRTASALTQNAYDSCRCPPAPSRAPPPLKRLEGRSPVNPSPNMNGPDSFEEPIYMEATRLEKSLSYIQLDDVKCNNSPPLRHHLMGVPHSTTSNRANNRHFTNWKILSNFPENFPNNLDLSVSHSPRQSTNSHKISSSTQNMASNSLNLWPSTSSLTPSNKTIPLTPSKKKSMNCNFALNSWSRSSGVDSQSSHSENISPFPGHTPVTTHCPSNLSQHSTFIYPIYKSLRNSNATLSDCGSTHFHSYRISQEKDQHLTAWNHVYIPSSQKTPEPDTTSFSSIDSVFTPGDHIGGAHLGSGIEKCLYKRCSLLRQHPPLTPASSHPQGHLSKSCGDVSPAIPTPPQWDPILANMHQSAPTLPGDQSGEGFFRPALRRVSQMFLGSGSLYSPGSENSKKPDPKNFLNSSKVASDFKVLDKILDSKGLGTRKLGSRTLSEVSLRKDKVSLPSSPQRPSASSVSSSSFLHYKYNRLEKINNADQDALLP